DAAQRDGGFEHIGVTHYPVGHVSAIASTGHAQTRAVDPRVLLQNDLDSVHNIGVVLAAPFAHDAALELLAITGRAPRIAEEDRPAASRVHLKLVEPVHSVGAGRTSVDAQYHRIALALLPSQRLHEKAIHIPVIRALVADPLYILQLKLLPQSLVHFG